MEVTDLQHLQIIDAITRELQDILVEYNRRANGMTDKAPLIALRIEQLDALADSIKKNRRILEFQNGKKVEPEVHHGEAVLIAVGGGGT